MEYDQDANAMNFVSSFLLGAIVGVGIALLMAPDSGNRTGRKIRRVAGGLKDSATDQLDDCCGGYEGEGGRCGSRGPQALDNEVIGAKPR